MPVPKNTGAPPGTTPNMGALYIELTALTEIPQFCSPKFLTLGRSAA